MLLFKKIIKRHKLALISILVVLGVVILVAIFNILHLTKLGAKVKLCRTTMPNGSINNLGCQ
jgi:hypothetical protein